MTLEREYGDQIFAILCKEIQNREWKNSGYLNYRRLSDKMELDGSGSPVHWKLRKDYNIQFNGFTLRQNRKLTRLLKRLDHYHEEVKQAKNAKELLTILDPDAEARAAANEVRTWIET